METRLLQFRGEPKDIAYCATWLVSDEARYVTGADFAVDAGATAWRWRMTTLSYAPHQ